jgi:hypothetical protein
MKTVSSMMLGFVERLAEMFPNSTYQSRFEAYLANKNIQDGVDLDHWQRRFDQEMARRQGGYL